MKNALRILGFLWLLPATIVVWALYILPFWALGYLVYKGSAEFLVAKFHVTGRDCWYRRAWNLWGGFSGPCVVIFRDEEQEGYDLVHEARHTWQMFWLGPLFYPIYWVMTLWIGLFSPEKSPYLDNPLERDARRVAGQKVNTTRADWPGGKRWPWF